MLVILSDLHLMDTTAGRHNLRPDSFRDVFLGHLAGVIADSDNNISSVEILLMGDIFDFIRTQRWFEVDPSDRPWGSNGLKDITAPARSSVTERQCLKILGNMDESPQDPPQKTILHQNWETFNLLRRLEDQLNSRGEEYEQKRAISRDLGVADEASAKPLGRVTVKLTYFPGNHDRVVRVYPSVRAEALNILGIDDPDPAKRLRDSLMYEEYGVFARHGHEYDQWNFKGTGGSGDPHLNVPVGDIITTELASKIPWTLEKMLQGKHPDIVERLKDIDNVRPLGKVFAWLDFKIRKGELNQVQDALKKAIEQVLSDLKDIDAISDALSNSGMSGAVRSYAWKVIRNLLPEPLSGVLVDQHILPLVLDLKEATDDPKGDVYAEGAYHEKIWEDNPKIKSIVYGHTHVPTEALLKVVVDGHTGSPASGITDREVYYINTGTWRSRIQESVKFNKEADFAALRELTCAFFYNSDEIKTKQPATRNFEIWSGVE